MLTVNLTDADLVILLGLVRRAVGCAQRRMLKRLPLGKGSGFPSRKLANLRDLQRRLILAGGGR